MTALYQVAALLRTLDDAASSGDAFEAETMVAQTDRLIMSAISALDGPDEAEMVVHLLRLRDDARDRAERAERDADIDLVRETAMRAVNAYFLRMLHGGAGDQGLHRRPRREAPTVAAARSHDQPPSRPRVSPQPIRIARSKSDPSDEMLKTV